MSPHRLLDALCPGCASLQLAEIIPMPVPVPVPSLLTSDACSGGMEAFTSRWQEPLVARTQFI